MLQVSVNSAAPDGAGPCQTTDTQVGCLESLYNKHIHTYTCTYTLR